MKRCGSIITLYIIILFSTSPLLLSYLSRVCTYHMYIKGKGKNKTTKMKLSIQLLISTQQPVTTTTTANTTLTSNPTSTTTTTTIDIGFTFMFHTPERLCPICGYRAQHGIFREVKVIISL